MDSNQSRPSKLRRESVLPTKSTDELTFVYEPPLSPSFYLYSNRESINEGESVTFTLSSNRVLYGYFVPYEITGISSSDLVGYPSLLSYFVIHDSNASSVTYIARADATTETEETMRLTLTDMGAPQFAEVIINDTSLTPIFELYSNKSSVNEGESVTFTLDTLNVANGTIVPYQISGQINAFDLAPTSSFVGYFVVDNGSARVTFITRADATTENNEVMRLSLTHIGSPIFAEVIINDTSVAPPDYTLYSDKFTYNEDQTITFILETQGVSHGQIVPFEVTGMIDSYDFIPFSGPPLTGIFVVQPAIQTTLNSAGSATVQYKLNEDMIREGTESMIVTLKTIGAYTCPLEAVGKAHTVQIIDTSYVPPAYFLNVNSLTANETTANTITFSLYAENINLSDFPKIVPFIVTGVTPNDFNPATNQLSGTFVLYDNQELVYKTFKVIEDSISEGNETMKLTLQSHNGISCPLEAQNIDKSVLIYDTSTFPPGYTISITPTSVNEGSNIEVSLTTTGVNNGTKVPFIIHGSGITPSDLTTTPVLTGVFEVTGATSPFAGVAPVTVTKTYTTALDIITETNENLYVTLTSVGLIACPLEAEGKFDIVIIQDTSTNAFINQLRFEDSANLVNDFHFELSNPNYTYHYANVGSSYPRPSDDRLAVPLSNLQPVTHIITNDSTNTFTKLPLGRIYTGLGGTGEYVTNMFGSPYAGIKLLAPNKQISWLADIHRTSVLTRDITGGTKAFTFYIVYQVTNLPGQNGYFYIAYVRFQPGQHTSVPGNLFNLLHEGSTYKINLTHGVYLNTVHTVTTPSHTSSNDAPRIFGFSFDGVNNVVSYADGSGAISGEIAVPNESWAVRQTTQFNATATYQVYFVSDLLGNPNATESQLAELWIQPGYTNLANLQLQVNQLKTKWGI